jgi:hypothetical protein
LLIAFLLCLPTLVQAQRAPAGLKRINTPFYLLYTDVSPDLAREASVRMTALAAEYSARMSMFGGRSPRGMPFYLFENQMGYMRAGGMPGSAGVFMSRWNHHHFVEGKLMAFLQGDDFRARKETWRTVQHEGFHQFSAVVIGGRKPPWIEEGLAQTFETAEFCGDSFVSNLAPREQIIAVQESIKNKSYMPFDKLLLMEQREWNARMSGDLYLQTWSMAYFLLNADEGRYLKPTEMFVALIGRGKPWQEAFLESYGPPAGFEEEWAAWWMKQDPDLSKLDFLAATLRKLTAFAARAELADQPHDTFESLAASVENPRLTERTWLPPGLLEEALAEAKQVVERDGGAWSIEMVPAEGVRVRRLGGGGGGSEQRAVVYTDGEGRRYQGTYRLNRREVRSVDIKIVENDAAQ